MKKHILLLTISSLLFITASYGQQLPLNENYFVNRYNLSSAYAGNSENNSVFASYRRDWSGVTKAPSTIRLSYHNGFKSNVGLGGKLIMDRIGIFQSFYGMASYTYRIQSETGRLLFGLSAGINQRYINFSDYYSNPSTASDPVMASSDVKSKLKFISDFSIVYALKNFQTGLLFSNIGFGNYSYSEVSNNYSPFLNYQVHAIYTLPLKGTWEFSPLAIYRGGKNIREQLELAGQLKYNDKFWGSLALRGKNIFCISFGLNAGKELIINYAYNFSTGIAINTFQNHELTIGLNLSAFSKPEDKLSMLK